MFAGGTGAFVAAALLVSAVTAQDQVVTSITPLQGSLNGGVRLTIYGRGFAADQFNFGAGREQLGNAVWLISSTQSYVCDVFKEGCNQEQIQCNTRPMPADTYAVSVAVDGHQFTDGQLCPSNKANCAFTPSLSFTPILAAVTPLTGPPGTLVTLSGTIFTSRYGSNVVSSTNGKLQKILRAYFGGQGCEMMENATTPAATPFGIQLDNDGLADTGYIQCQQQGTYISNTNGSFLIEAPYGRSLPLRSVLRVSANDAIAMFQTYAVVTGVSPVLGSVAGGTTVTITGQYFDETDAPLRVEIDGQECAVKNHTDNQVICTTGPKSTMNSSAFQGGRGLLHEIWHQTSITGPLSGIAALSTSSPQYEKRWIDQSSFSYAETRFVTRTRGFFVPTKDSDYKINVQAQGGSAAVYFSPVTGAPEDKVQVASSSNNWVGTSERHHLSAGKAYYIEILHQATSATNSLTVSVDMFTTHFTESMTGAATNEVQKLSTSTEAVAETQHVSFVYWPAVYQAETVNEKQVVTLTGISAATNFRLQLGGARTTWLAASSSAAAVAAELNGLPSVYPDSVTVTSDNSGSSQAYTVTFISTRGIWPLLAVEFPPGDFSLARVTRSTPGQPSSTTVMLEMDGVQSRPFSPNATVEEVGSVVKELYSVRCPRALAAPADGATAFFTDFEEGSTYLYTDNGNYWGQRSSDHYPFCGRTSLKNPQYVFTVTPAIALNTYPKLCFAYRGLVHQWMGFGITYFDTTMKTVSEWYFIADLVHSDSWKYTCVDMLQLFKLRHNTGSLFQVQWAQIYSNYYDIFIDNVYIGKQNAVPDNAAAVESRLMPPKGYLMSGVDVTSSQPYQYTISLSPVNCSHDFSLFTVPGSVIYSQSANNDTIDDEGSDVTASYDPSNSDSSSSRNDSQSVAGSTNSSSSSQPGIVADVIVNVTRVSSASTPVGGTFDVTLLGAIVKGVPGDSSAETLAALLQFVPGVGTVSVDRQGSCQGYTWTTKFLTRGGDVPTMVANGTQLLGTGAQVAVTSVTDGHVTFAPVLGDMLRVLERSPQVTVYVNNIPTHCDDQCEFAWDTSVTPQLQSVAPQSGMSTQELTITGSGFGSGGEVEVKLGDTQCSVSSASNTQIVCTAAVTSRGNYSVQVTVAGLGRAAGQLTYQHSAEITSIYPSFGNLAGGTILTLSGMGFESSMSITIGSAPCPLLAFTDESAVTCTTPPAPGSAGNATVSIRFEDNTVETSSNNFGYVAVDNPAVISGISLTSASVEGNTTITISGTGFGPSSLSDKAVTLGGQAVATIVSYSDSTIIVTLPAMPPGSYPLYIMTNNGYADLTTNSIPDIAYALEVHDFQPKHASLYGGTAVTVTGIGFSTEPSRNIVSFGNVLCEVQTSSDTSIECTIAEPFVTHHVDNSGTKIGFGSGYSWYPSSLTVMVGDSVEWTWQAPVQGVAYSVQQVDGPSSNVPVPGGFSSGSTSTSKGSYRHRFTSEGTFFYWSKTIDTSRSLALWGVVHVHTRPDHSAQVRVEVAGNEAALVPANRRKRELVKRDAASCTAELATCDSAASSFDVTFSACSTPVVTSVWPNKGTVHDSLYFSGTGFSSQACNNIVTVGGEACAIQYSNETLIVCSVNPNGILEPGVALSVRLVVSNIGSAMVNGNSDEAQSFVLVPWVDSIFPTAGSTAGGQKITITGGGFGGSTQVIIGLAQCTVVDSSYSSIVCVTASSPQRTDNVSVAVTNSVPAVVTAENVCPGGCVYSYTHAATPVVASVSPQEVSGSSTQMSIGGVLFGNNASVVQVTIGGVECTVDVVTDSSINCTVGSVPVGNADVVVTVFGKGKAANSGSITSLPTISQISPTSGSLNGGTSLTLTGSGFVNGSTSVTIGGAACKVQTVTLTEVVCITSAHASEAAANVVVLAAGTTYPTKYFAYSTSSTPTVSSITPSAGVTGDSITLAGIGLSDAASVLIGNVPCAAVSGSASQIVCRIGAASSGLYELSVLVPETGLASIASGVRFTYTMAVTGVLPNSGSYAGGQQVRITGSGFDNNVVLTICGNVCAKGSVTPTSYDCITPSNTGLTASTSCAIVASSNGLDVTLAAAYEYLASKTAAVTGVSPARGGTAGGTQLTISGSGFMPSASSTVTVTIDGSACTVTSSTDTVIHCQTGAHQGTQQAQVEVNTDGNGIAKQTNASFWYVDRWSSVFTWGGTSLPTDGDFVVIQAGQTILLDTDTPVLKMLLIQGGTLMFDEQDVELKAENILITDQGRLQIGTEDRPFQHKAIITLYGHLRSMELPVYGAKTLGVRNGTLDLHGKPRVPWTVLSSTAAAGANTISLSQAVDWEAGDHIVIATTGNEVSQFQNEEGVIASVSADGKTVTLVAPLAYEHLGITATFSNGQTLEMRAEVGLLTHNVVVRGSVNHQWDEVIAACPAGFDPGEFAVQTCFQGRFGEEMGSDGFGAAIMMSSPEMDKHWATHRLSYVEVTHAGQQFRIGRYPIHLHMNGDMSDSYVRGCSIHHTFNRAMNIHQTHNTLFEYNVIYHVEGGAVFLEDSIEHGNVLQYNLAVHVIPSSTLLNDDVTPAAFWLTFPNNTLQHNHAAGGSHFGFWYRMLDHPNGPSFDPNICPKKVPLGKFFNNTAHSLGWFGLWTFDEYFPVGTGLCTDTVPTPAVFEKLTSWHCTKGAEFVDAGAVQFKSFLMVNNLRAGIEGKRNFVPLTHQYADEGPLITDSTVVGSDFVTPGCSQRGIILPYSNGLTIRNTEFVDFNVSGCVALGMTTIDGICMHFCGGYTYRFSGMSWTNSPRRGNFRWEHEASFEDLDGSFAGLAGSKVVPHNPTLDPAVCVAIPGFSEGEIPGVRCNIAQGFHRMAWNNVNPPSLIGKNVRLFNDFGVSVLPYRVKDLTNKKGWFAMIPGGYDGHHLIYENADFITNITYTANIFHFDVTDYIIVKTNFTQRPDVFQILDGFLYNGSDCPINNDDNYNGDWCFDNDTYTLSYLVSGRDRIAKRAAAPATTTVKDRRIHLQVYQCYFDKCVPPAIVVPQPASCARPSTAKYWSNAATWPRGAPNAGSDLYINASDWIVLDVSNPPNLGKLYIYGTLELEYKPVNGVVLNIELSATHILIQGGHLMAGCPGQPITGQVTITLLGDHSTPELLTPNGGPVVGAKAIGAFGGLDLHGKPRNTYWTRLSQTANAGSSDITVADPVDWVAGDEIVIATSVFSSQQNEKAEIAAVSEDGRTLTLRTSLSFTHLGLNRVTGQYSYSLSAEVGLLSRNLKVVGSDYSNLKAEAFGARILVGTFYDGTSIQTGYARVENVEFFHTGQDGFVADYDPRFSLAWLDSGDVSEERPSYCRHNAFHDGFNTAVGVHGTSSGVVVENNVIYKTVGAGIIVSGINVTIKQNLVMSSMFSGSYNGRFETANSLLMGSIEVYKGTNVTLADNAVAGSERSGYRIKGIPCDGDIAWSGNVAHGVLLGVDIMPESVGTDPCTWITGFVIYKAWYFGVYSQCPYNTKVSNVILVENTLSLMTYVIFPDIVSHAIADRFIQYQDLLLVGHDDAFDCDDAANSTDPSVIISLPNMASWNTPSGGRVGMTFGSFMSNANGAPGKPYRGIMSYNGLYGRMNVSGVTFANFGTYCSGKRDAAISTSIGNDDLQHPLYMHDLILINVDHGSKVFYFRPDLGKINSADCVDMDCDGKKKNLIKDLDGSFLGVAGAAVIPQAQFEWNGDPQRGLGDYRIPKTLLTDLSGNRIPVNTIAPYKGIIDNQNCTFVDEWLAYECKNGIDYEMLIIESMDADTETRRLSPVAILADKYIDLINGPQDHGWCHGYTCRKRVSTFNALVACGMHHALHFSGTSPQKLRLHLINTLDTQQITLEIYYSISNRIDIYINGVYVPPLNAYVAGGATKYYTPQYACQYCPNSTSGIGANFQDRWSQLMYVAVRGPTPVDVVMTELVLVSFEVPAMTVDEFFGANIIKNLALFLGIPSNKIRIVNVVSEATSVTGRRRRSITPGSVVVQFEIGDAPPLVSLNETITQSMNYSQLQAAYQQLTDAVQLGVLSPKLNVTFTKVFLVAPVPSSNSSDWGSAVAAADLVAGTPVSVVIPSKLALSSATPSGAVAGNVLLDQPSLQLLSSDNILVTTFGSIVWAVTASLSCSSDPSITFNGTKTINITQGWANYSDLTVNSAADGCQLTFCVSNPNNCATMSTATGPFTVMLSTTTASGSSTGTTVTSVSSSDSGSSTGIGSSSTAQTARKPDIAEAAALPAWAIAVITVGAVATVVVVVSVAVILAKKAALAAHKVVPHGSFAPEHGIEAAVMDSPPAATGMPTSAL